MYVFVIHIIINFMNFISSLFFFHKVILFEISFIFTIICSSLFTALTSYVISFNITWYSVIFTFHGECIFIDLFLMWITWNLRKSLIINNFSWFSFCNQQRWACFCIELLNKFLCRFYIFFIFAWRIIVCTS